MCNNKFQIVLQAPDLLSAKTLIEQNVIGRRQVRTQWPRSLNLSHNLSWRGEGGVEEKLGGLQFFLDGIWGALKCQKMTLGGLQVSFK